MKKELLIVLFVGLCAILSGCGRYPISQQSGKDDVAFLLFVGQQEVGKSTVDVTLDGNTSFKAETVKAKKATLKGQLYQVNPGRRKIKVEKDGKVLYEKEIMLSTQETKKIMLP